jgi:hypothetical protein
LVPGAILEFFKGDSDAVHVGAFFTRKELQGVLEELDYKHPPEFEATHRHKKTGGLYRVLGTVKHEADWSDEVLYENEQGQRITRPYNEFHDGRFEELKR